MTKLYLLSRERLGLQFKTLVFWITLISALLFLYSCFLESREISSSTLSTIKGEISRELLKNNPTTNFKLYIDIPNATRRKKSYALKKKESLEAENGKKNSTLNKQQERSRLEIENRKLLKNIVNLEAKYQELLSKNEELAQKKPSLTLENKRQELLKKNGELLRKNEKLLKQEKSSLNLKAKYQELLNEELSKRENQEKLILKMKAKYQELLKKVGETKSTKLTVDKINDDNGGILYVVTPTYYRLTQRAEMTRLRNTLSHVERVHWVVIEDAEKTSPEIARILEGANVYKTSYIHSQTTTFCTPANYTRCHRGLKQRNDALNLIQSFKPSSESVVYFADDDNSYDVRIFEEIKSTKRLSMFPVGFLGKLKYGGPICKKGKVTNFHAGFAKARRKWPVDMAGFAFNASLLSTIKPSPRFNKSSRKGHTETDFISQLINNKSQIEPKADCCSKIYVWHTKTLAPDISKEKIMPSNPKIMI